MYFQYAVSYAITEQHHDGAGIELTGYPDQALCFRAGRMKGFRPACGSCVIVCFGFEQPVSLQSDAAQTMAAQIDQCQRAAGQESGKCLP